MTDPHTDLTLRLLRVADEVEADSVAEATILREMATCWHAYWGWERTTKWLDRLESRRIVTA